ncbi:hypothetical protein LTR78_004172 [Recurvomyces mirabilis]|uniref:Aminoglycoside phosphotransferase domain-containing protein n=1 Tax=Recurvomyces mirabilis TaxID=574656 RepID=A0AAE0WQ86_9PEZI|nr:hypothetical protein LTR78_004172 [Recurvomyces mirabilis]KAK5153657.1 hypothetical protein LTS14_007351 [Recurvomyces mirabilis]
MSALGSDAWLNASAYDSTHPLHTRAADFIANIDWSSLTKNASQLRHGIPCTLSEKFSVGHFNMVRRLEFEDGVLWIARLRLPELNSVFGEREALDVENSMRIEVGTLKYIREKTAIPVPDIHSYKFGSEDSTGVGAPYILMSYIHGNVAQDLQEEIDGDSNLFGTPEQDQNFRRQMVEIQFQLANLTFDRIGAVYQDGDVGFKLGPEIETGLGPWATPQMYWDAWAHHAAGVARKDCTEETKLDASIQLPVYFNDLMAAYGQSRQTRFGLVNRDFGAHNVLVDKEFNILALIDVDGVIAAPIERVAQFPCFMSLERPAPGYVERRPAAIERLKGCEGFLEKYAETVREFRASQGASASSGGPKLEEVMMSDGASIVQGLIEYGQHQIHVNQRWLGAYEKFMRKIGKEVDRHE